MKKFIVTALLGLICFAGFGQTSKKTKAPTKLKVEVVQDTTTKPQLQLPKGTTVFVLSPEQVQLLEYVISESDASFQKTQALIKILQTQQYHPGDSTASKQPAKVDPLPPGPQHTMTAADSTGAKH